MNNFVIRARNCFSSVQLNKFDIIIIGGGYMGLSIAGALADNDFKCAVIEKADLSNTVSTNEPGRLLAIAYQSTQIFKDYNLVTSFAQLGQEINSIKVHEGNSDNHVHFNPKQVGLSNFGYMVDEYVLFKELYNNVKSKVTIFDSNAAFNTCHADQEIIVELKRKKLSSKLIIIADGKRSLLRKKAGIECFTHNYNQYAVVCDIKHEFDHQGIATERFMSEGPFATLPKKGGHLSSIVWTIKQDLYPALKSMDDLQIQELIQMRADKGLGKVELASKIKFFPLELVVAKEYFYKRQVLIGDSLHSIHPLAGQGLNLSLRDLKCLTELLIKYRSLGIDIGNETIFEEYEKKRLLDNNLMIEGTHNLNFLFSNDFMPVKLLRKHGLNLVENLPFIKNIFMQYACGR